MTTTNTLVSLEEVKSLLKSRLFNSETKEGGWVLALSPTVIDELDSIPTIDPIATIDEMIEENEEQSEYPDSQYNAGYRHGLQELKSRLSTNS